MALDDLPDEHEQGERVRSWLKSNGLSLVGGVALAFAVIFGWQGWQKGHTNKRAQAHQDYAAAMDSLDAGNLEQASAGVQALAGGNAAYEDIAALRLSKAQLAAGDRDAAIATLRAVETDPDLSPLLNLRLARLLIDAGQVDEALGLLGEASDPSSLEVRGDALVAAGKVDDARETYLKALTGMDVAAPQRRLVELKLADVGGSAPKSAEPI